MITQEEQQTTQAKRILDCVDSLLPMLKKPKTGVWEKRVGKYFHFFNEKENRAVQVVPQPQQIRALNFMHSNKGLILYHTTGTGKTLSALMCAVDFLLESDENIVYVVAPPATIESTWKDSIEKYINPANFTFKPKKTTKKKQIQTSRQLPPLITTNNRGRKRKLQQVVVQPQIKRARIQRAQQIRKEAEIMRQIEGIKKRIRIITTYKLKTQTAETGFQIPSKRFCMYIIDEAQNFVIDRKSVV